ncbi:MAG: 4-hydroxy-tetrahydrodipicolinate synthase [Candidatus Hydrogenedentota bacterium]
MQFKFQGIVPAMLTPFTQGGKSVDYDKAAALAEYLAKQGVHGLFVCGTTGEGPLMTLPERKQILETVVQAVGKKVKVIAHTGCLDTASTIELTRHAQEAGAHAAGVVAPSFFGYDEESLKRHFTAVANSARDLPILLYNIPGCAKNALSRSLIVDLATNVDNIVGMKDSGGSIQHFNDVLTHVPKGFVAINGVDEYSMQALVAGGSGIVASTANVLPELFLSIFNNVKKGNLKKAWESQVKLSQACGTFRYGAMVSRYKEGVRLRGFDPGFVRPPQRELTPAERRTLAKEMQETGLL